MNKNYINAINFVMDAHHGQYDKCGDEYWHHCDRVAKIVGNVNKENISDVVYIALFHDIIEDVENGEELLKKYLTNIPNKDHIFESVKLLTKDNHMKYDEYISMIINTGNRDAISVKFCDIKDHVDRLYMIQDNNIRERLYKKYCGKMKILNDYLKRF